jgi:hypothetical protein
MKTIVSQYTMIDLKEFYCNNGISSEGNISKGNFTGGGSSFPSELLPNFNKDVVIVVNDVPFQLNKSTPDCADNMEFNNQYIKFKPNIYKTINVLGCADNGSYIEPIFLVTNNTSIEVKLGLTDWLAEKPLFDEQIAFRCEYVHTQRGKLSNFQPTIWCQKINLFNSNMECLGMKFIDNPSMHIFAITLEIKE